MLQLLHNSLIASVALIALSSCTMIDSAVRSIPTPTISGVANMIPGLGSGDSTGSDDPKIAFAPHLPLSPGHTLRLAVYDGSRTAKKLYEGVVMVDSAGIIEFKGIGSARIGGRSAADARAAIESVFRAAGRAGSRVHVHLISIENMPLVAVEGDVARPVVLELQKGLTVSLAVSFAGGRVRNSVARSVYVSHEGLRRFFVTEAAANDKVDLEPGDIIQLSPDL
ncbi:MAG: SLBB domain-containing protein [Verrucomicrobiaceae bacterium]|nr:SLBB domain-containing protein [Verrucomicrobiaceae bacterium]